MGSDLPQQTGVPAVRRRLRRRAGLRVAIAAAAGYVAWCGVLYVYQDTLVFPASYAPRPSGQVPASATVSWLDTDAGSRTPAWFLPAPGADAARTPAVIFFHGNCELIESQESTIDGYHALGVSVLLPEYRGYGLAGGTPSEEGIVSDCVQFYDQLAARSDVDRKRILFHGRSLGGGVAAQVAAQRPPAAMILEVTFTSVASMSSAYWAPSFLAKHPFHTDRVIQNMTTPLLIFGATRDTIVPVEHSRKLHALRPDSTYVEYDCGHVDLGAVGGENYWREIKAFLARAGIVE